MNSFVLGDKFNVEDRRFMEDHMNKFHSHLLKKPYL